VVRSLARPRDPGRYAARHRATKAKVIGVHAIEADEPVHLIELLVEGDTDEFDIGEVTQETPGQPKSNWQVPYDERVLEESEQLTRFAFFFHFLDFERPLLTPAGSLSVPPASKIPVHLKDIEYESP
jgi:hypothetical protein